MGGVVVDLGYLESGAGNGEGGYYWVDIDLCGLDWVPLQSDAAGSYKLWFMKYDAANPEEYVLATCAQPMLWGLGEGEHPIQDCTGRGEMSHQIGQQWDDTDPINAWHDAPQENYEYTYEFCPDPLGAMACFYVNVAEPECLGDLDGDNDTDHSDLGILLSNWGCTGGNCAGDIDGDGHTGHADLGILLGDWGCGS